MLNILPCVEKYLLKCWVNSHQLSPNWCISRPWYHSLAKCCKVCLNLLLYSTLSNSIASIQSSVASKWTSSLSLGSPLNTGGGILTWGLTSSSPELVSTLSSVSLLPKGLAFHFSYMCIEGHLPWKPCAGEQLIDQYLKCVHMDPDHIIPCHCTRTCCWCLLFLVFLWEFLLFLHSHHLLSGPSLMG